MYSPTAVGQQWNVRVLYWIYEVMFPGPSDGQSLLSKVIAVETIIRDLHGPADATLWLPGTTRPRCLCRCLYTAAQAKAGC
jgi:hypothetical protein